MPEDGSKENANDWPLPQFYFTVDFGAALTNIPFQEVSGLETETQIIEYRASNSPLFSTIKVPGLAKFANITLKKGIFVKDNRFFNWLNTIQMNMVQRTTFTIKLLDEVGKPTMTWTLNNAFPVKIKGIDMKSDGNEVAVETIEIAYAELVITNI